MAKIIPLYKFKNIKASPLTSLMIKTLTAACEKQNNHEPFGQADLNGSFLALLKRGFIDCSPHNLQGKDEVIWFVTKAGIKALGESDVKCLN